MKRSLLLERLGQRWTLSTTSHVHETPKPPFSPNGTPTEEVQPITEPPTPPVVLVPVFVGPVASPLGTVDIPPVIDVPRIPLDTPQAVDVHDLHTTKQDEVEDGDKEPTEERSVSVDGLAHQMHLFWGISPFSNPVAAWSLGEHPHAAAMHHEEPETHTPHVFHHHDGSSGMSPHLHVPVSMTAHGTMVHDEEEIPTESAHEHPVRSHPQHSHSIDIPPDLPTANLRLTEPELGGLPILAEVSQAEVLESTSPIEAFHDPIAPDSPRTMRLFGWCSLSMLMLWCSWQVTTKPRPSHRLQGNPRVALTS